MPASAALSRTCRPCSLTRLSRESGTASAGIRSAAAADSSLISACASCWKRWPSTFMRSMSFSSAARAASLISAPLCLQLLLGVGERLALGGGLVLLLLHAAPGPWRSGLAFGRQVGDLLQVHVRDLRAGRKRRRAAAAGRRRAAPGRAGPGRSGRPAPAVRAPGQGRERRSARARATRQYDRPFITFQSFRKRKRQEFYPRFRSGVRDLKRVEHRVVDEPDVVEPHAQAAGRRWRCSVMPLPVVATSVEDAAVRGWCCTPRSRRPDSGRRSGSVFGARLTIAWRIDAPRLADRERVRERRRSSTACP